MAERALQDLVQRLERERLDADRRYHDAFAALDAAVRALPDGAPALEEPGPAAPPAELAHAIHEAGVPPDSGMLPRLVQRVAWPAHEAQQRVNAALVAELQRARVARETLARSLRVMADAIAADRAASARLHTDLVVFLQTITEYVDAKDRALGGPELREQIILANERTMALKREIEGLRTQGSGLPSTAHRPPPTDFSYVGFEDRFRGSEADIRARVAEYIPLFAGADPRPDAWHPVLDVGCGRGELLGLLSEAGIPARGIDLNGEMVALCRERGFAADHADALTFLDAQPDASLGGLTAIQVVEHLEPPYLGRFLETAFHKLRPGAPIVLETINPACWMAFFETYLRDLTHAQPIHADVLRFLVQAAGFSSVDVQFRGAVSDDDRLKKVNPPTGADPPALRAAVDALNANADALNARLFGYMDYAVVAKR